MANQSIHTSFSLKNKEKREVPKKMKTKTRMQSHNLELYLGYMSHLKLEMFN